MRWHSSINLLCEAYSFSSGVNTVHATSPASSPAASLKNENESPRSS